MFRRTFLKGLLGTISALFITKVKAVDEAIAVAEPVLDEGFVSVPDWCPKGWLPVMGQTITPKQFPNLFERQTIEGLNGRSFVPMFWKKSTGTLSEMRPRALTDLERDGYFPQTDVRLTRYQPRDDTYVTVNVISTEPQKWPGGRVSPPGFYSMLRVRREHFEKYYGEIDAPSLDETYSFSMRNVPIV
jgi:hypothetical protein